MPDKKEKKKPDSLKKLSREVSKPNEDILSKLDALDRNLYNVAYTLQEMQKKKPSLITQLIHSRRAHLIVSATSCFSVMAFGIYWILFQL